MAIGAALGVGSALMGYSSSKKQASAAKNAAATQAQSASEANQLQWDMYDQTRQDLNPYKEAGYDSLKQLMGGMGEGGRFMETFSGQDIYNDPSYQFRLNEGLNAVQSGAAGQGGLLSGATQKALNNYAQESASQEYQNAYNRFNADQTNQYNRLANLVGVGQNAAAQTGNLGAQTAQSVANNTMAAGNSTAAGIVGAADARAQGNAALLGGLGSLKGIFI